MRKAEGPKVYLVSFRDLLSKLPKQESRPADDTLTLKLEQDRTQEVWSRKQLRLDQALAAFKLQEGDLEVRAELLSNRVAFFISICAVTSMGSLKMCWTKGGVPFRNSSTSLGVVANFVKKDSGQRQGGITHF